MGPVRSHAIPEIHVPGDAPNPTRSFIDLWLMWTNPLSFHWANKLTLDNVSESFRRWAVTSFLWGRSGERIWFRRVNAGSERKYLRSAAEQMRTGKKKKNSWHFHSLREKSRENQFTLAQRNSQTACHRDGEPRQVMKINHTYSFTTDNDGSNSYSLYCEI